MFVANNQSGKPVNVAENRLSKEQLRYLRENNQFYCPVCGNELDLKIGHIVKAHFAHKRLSGCTANHISESDYHMKGKADLYKWLSSQKHFNVMLEPYLNEINQRPDILLEKVKQRIPIEYQCSSIAPSILLKRTNSYTSIQMTPLWILGGKMLTRVGEVSFLLPSFQWHFIQTPRKWIPPHIIYYCSKQEAFIILNAIIPFSTRLIFSNHMYYPIKSISFEKLFNIKVELRNVYSKWFEHVKQFRLKPQPYQTKETRSFNRLLYRAKQRPLTYLPALAFLPLRTGYLIESPIYIWQGFILLYLDNIPINHTFSFRHVCTFVNQKIKNKQIKIRILHQIKEDYSLAIREYLSKLSHFKLIKQFSRNSYQKLKAVNWSNQLDDLINEDKLTMETVNKFFR
ncbi:competence protein CoiA [Metabacillus malikii]|nr:competence protein CoiA family protein [Metabacillus malikii]